MDRLLVIAPFDIVPPYWGAATRIFNLTRYLAADYVVTLLYVRYRQLDVDVKAKAWKASCENIRRVGVPAFTKYSQVFNPLLILIGLVLAFRHRPLLILAETGWSGLHALLLSWLTRTTYILDEHNVESVAFKRMNRGGRLGTTLLRLYERVICRFAHRILCVSEEDRQLLASEFNLEMDKIIVVPNGVDTERFHPDPHMRSATRDALDIPESTPLILFNGKLDYRPNYNAVDIIYREIIPRVLSEVPDAKFLIIGSHPPREFSHESLMFLNTVDRIEDYLNAADVVICPLLSGGGTRFKVLEAVACGKRVISTTVGAEGLIGKETEPHLTCADDWDLFAAKVIDALNGNHDIEPNRHFVEKYGWDSIISVLKSHAFST